MILSKKVEKTINQYNLFKTGDKVIVAVSGGPDSVTMLHILNGLRYRIGLHLSVAHLNHGLRKSADLDQRFVRQVALQLNLPFFTSKVNLFATKKGLSLEESARNARIDFLSKLARRRKADCIALAHTKDDLAETVLMRIIRGAGLAGLRAILPKRKIGGILFVRPLLNTSRKEVEDYLRKNNLRFRNDPTNKNEKIFRNKIRRRLIPLIEKEYSKNIKETLAILADNSIVDYTYLEQQGTSALRRLSKKLNQESVIQIDIGGLGRLHLALRKTIIRLAIEKLTGNTRRLTAAHTREIEDLIFSRPTLSVVNLPRTILVSKTKSYLNIRVRNT